MERPHYSLSTAWNWTRHTSGYAIVDEIRSAGFKHIELNFTLTAPIVEEIAACVRNGSITVSSLHNICPLPSGIAPADASPDCYSLASPDTATRQRAIAETKRTIDCAARLGARAVVLHAGRVEIADHTRELAALVDAGAATDELRARMIAERQHAAGPHLDAVMHSLDTLARYAVGCGIALGVENRYYYREIPTIDEFDMIFERIGAGRIWYWHDVGHAAAFERLGLLDPLDLLRRQGKRLLGIHLHDIIGAMQDHRAPGTGSVDFATLRPFIGPDTIRVIEVNRQVDQLALERGYAHLRQVFDP